MSVIFQWRNDRSNFIFGSVAVSTPRLAVTGHLSHHESVSVILVPASIRGRRSFPWISTCCKRLMDHLSSCLLFTRKCDDDELSGADKRRRGSGTCLKVVYTHTEPVSRHF